jgi:tetratricopeptide (TPR) repeat protein
MKSIFFVISALFLSFSGYSQTENTKAQEYYDIAMNKVFKKDHKGAIAGFSEAIKRDSGFIQAYENRGVSKYLLQDYSGAIDDYDKALNINPWDYNTYVRRGWARFSLHDYTGAFADFNKAVDESPDDPQYYNSRGEAKYRLQDYKGAIADFNMVINRWYSGRDQKSIAYFWLGIVKFDMGLKVEGCDDLKKAWKLGNIKAYEAIKGYCQ